MDTQYSACFDLSHGYFQIPLTEDSQELTTFIVSENDAATWYCYTRSPQGLALSGYEFCACTDAVQKLVDDVGLEDETLDGLMEKVEEVFKRCQEHGIMLRRKRYRWDNA